MDFGVLQHWLASGLGFQVLVLLGVAGAYVAFELLMSLRTRAERDVKGLEAYRSVSGWGALPEID